MDENFSPATSGLRITGGSLGYFFDFDGPYFGIHFPWNRRLLLDTQTGNLVQQTSRRLEAAVLEAEVGLSRVLVERGLKTKPRKRKDRFLGALGCLLNHRPQGSQALFRTLETEPIEICAHTRSRTIPHAYCGNLGHRARAALALRLMGHKPLGFPAIGFFRGEDSKQLIQWPHRLSDRDQRLERISLDLPAVEVLASVGVPDRIDFFREGDEVSCLWGESWSYFRGMGEDTSEVVLTWEPGSEGRTLRDRSECQSPSVFHRSYF